MANDFLAFATAGGANVVTQAAYAAAGYVSTGRTAGILPSNVYNKIARQSSIAAYLIGQLISDQTGLDALDNGDLAVLLTRFKLAIQKTPAVATRTVLLSGTSETYNTPTNCRQLRIRMIGGGGGGAAQNTNNGSNGTATVFNSIQAAPGSGGLFNSGNGGGAGGTGGSGSASLRIAGGSGSAYSNTQNGVSGGAGGNGAFGGGAGSDNGSTPGNNAAANSGGGGSGAGSATGSPGAGGGAGEYVELIINSPAASYTYTVGAAGAGGAAGAQAGGNGGSGIIIVEEFY